MEPADNPVATAPTVTPTGTPPTPSSAPSQAPQKKNNTGLIVSIVVGGVVLLAVVAGLLFTFLAPKSTPNNTAPKQQAATQAPAENTPSTCITKEEALEMIPDERHFQSYGFIYGETYFFEADKAVFVTEFTDMQNTELDKEAAWIKKYSAKKFMVNLTPQIQDASVTSANEQLGTQRAEYIRSQLIQRGVKPDKIAILPTTAEHDETESSKLARRNVNLAIVGDETCAVR